MTKYYCTRCGGGVEVVDSRPSLDPRYAIGRCSRHTSDKSSIEVQAMASKGQAADLIATRQAAQRARRIERHELTCKAEPPRCTFNGCANSRQPASAEATP